MILKKNHFSASYVRGALGELADSKTDQDLDELVIIMETMADIIVDIFYSAHRTSLPDGKNSSAGL